MPYSGTYTRGYNIAGSSFGVNTTITSNLLAGWSVTLAAAKVGTLAVRTSDTAGTLTMNSGHGFTDGQKIDIYWDGGSCRNATIGTVSVNSVPFTGASGTVLPAALTAITAQVPTSESIVVTGSNVVSFGVGFPSGGTCVFAASGPTEVYAAVVLAPNTSTVWSSTDGGTNPLAGGSILTVRLSQGGITSVTATGTVQYD